MLVCFHYSHINIYKARYFPRIGFLTSRHDTDSHPLVLNETPGLLQLSLNHTGAKQTSKETWAEVPTTAEAM